MENLTGGTPPVRYLLCVVPCKLYFNDGITSSGVSLNEDGSISSRELEVDVRSLCGKLTRAAERYYHENAERFDFINFKIMGL